MAIDADLLLLLERRSIENAAAFIAVALDDDGNVFRASGPYEQPEQALAAAGDEERRWNAERSCPEDGSIRHVIVPLWEPGT